MDNQATSIKPQSRFGIASFVISLINLVGLFIAFVVAGYLHNTGQANARANTIVGLTIVFLGFLDLIALGFGIAGILDKSSKRTLSVMGTIFSGGAILLTGLLILVGLMLRHR